MARSQTITNSLFRLETNLTERIADLSAGAEIVTLVGTGDAELSHA
jgi:hypothetical protein